ncbi:hypothetical protein DDB_G0267320 [Dictyostelium discoideum AX4]|uniref:hypothetical protein n=1 Tax=Dictyostelium discoideum AX4 TaxID=352472 RepID=UPI00004E405A|nr:hypothetical protein DDB_G0267320 [Dictyostelium discoideum AX4]EAL73797.1 hypothetical protein DDB_G0267320 [Dictyostelium discoideum AX4]|eukprot:XP_647721.1 hypothetical protein DDB_G0267320 [Dictyostelium discoideum AX4]
MPANNRHLHFGVSKPRSTAWHLKIKEQYRSTSNITWLSVVEVNPPLVTYLED